MISEIDNTARMIDGQLCLSSAALGELFGVSRQALGKWASQGCPKSKPGWWPLAKVMEWRGITGSSTTDDSKLSDSMLKLKYEAELKRLQTEQLELRNSIVLGEYVAKDELISTLSRYFIELKRSLNGLSRKLATDISMHVDPTTARKIEHELSGVINDALERISSGNVYEPQKERKKRKA